MEDQIELVVAEEKRSTGGISIAVVLSLILHAGLLVLFVRAYRRPPEAKNVPIARYVELITQNPKQFTEAPGPKVDHAPLTAPYSDANRRASTPHPTGDQPTTRPGDGNTLYTPSTNPAPRNPQQRSAVAQQQMQSAPSPATQGSAAPTSIDTDQLVFKEPAKAAAASGAVNWKNAIKEVGKVASLGGDGYDFGQPGGEKGTAETGDLSFESQWYDWGDYAQSMVSRIRVNWYSIMPEILRTGLKGKVTIRFTIQRDGRITNVEILEGSGAPPYDYAAKKAIEMSSPLNPLPKDFPKSTERVVCIFFYNMKVPQ